MQYETEPTPKCLHTIQGLLLNYYFLFWREKNIWNIFFILHIFFQELKSPNYPYDYPGGLECLYILKAQGKGKIISLEILDLDMEPEKDFVLIRDGPTANDRELARLTGSKSEYSFIR